MEAIIQVMESVIGARDRYTVSHQQRVTRLAGALATAMGLSPERRRTLQTAAALHDLGKIAIPAEILAKPGKLTAIEFAMFKAHPQVGYDILKPLNFPTEIGQVMLQHHERLNGSGYPRGLKRKEILWEAQILSVADVVEAMCSHRPYRPALGLARAMEEISRSKGVLYDAGVVDACLKLCDQCREAEELFTAPQPSLAAQVIASHVSYPRGQEEDRLRERRREARLSCLFRPGYWANHPRFILHTATASILVALIILVNTGT